ncbi:MAG: hypothetical protein JNM56_10680 [Planctomycetia bacterium]|nr:hypothetical protein [Planctomycetia bacterium]
MSVQWQRPPVIHLRVDGQSREVPLGQFDLGEHSPDHEIKRAVAQHLGIAQARLGDYVIDRHGETGNLTIRPQAVFG